MTYIKLIDLCMEIYSKQLDKLLKSLESEFTRRYPPRLNLVDKCVEPSATIYWIENDDFKVLSTLYSSNSKDTYIVQGSPPEPYTNESPVFFLLQVIARSLVKKGYIILTDSVSIGGKSKNVLLLGFPHTGKSTIASIAISNNYNVFTTENTVLRIDRDRLRIITGTRVLVYDPAVKELYGVNITPHSRTKHGYEIIDLEKIDGIREFDREIIVDEIYLVYTSFSSTGFSRRPIKGRKISKLLWMFTTSLLKGLDYYYPHPLDTPLDENIINSINQFIGYVETKYSDRFFEVYGSPLEVFKSITTD
ncbi:MAG: hypothetical protein QXE81_04045 [Desulfurococcaceae archaeon]